MPKKPSIHDNSDISSNSHSEWLTFMYPRLYVARELLREDGVIFVSEVFKNRKRFGLNPVLEGFNKNDNEGKGAYKYVPVDGPGGSAKGNPYYTIEGVTGFFRYSNDENFEPSKIVLFGYNFESKAQRELAEALKNYKNKKSIELEILVRY